MTTTIRDVIELTKRAKDRVERARRNNNVHEDIEIIDGLVSLVEQLQEAIRDSATIRVAR